MRREIIVCDRCEKDIEGDYIWYEALFNCIDELIGWNECCLDCKEQQKTEYEENVKRFLCTPTRNHKRTT